MKYLTFVIALALFITLSSAQDSGTAKYVGVKNCMPCHKGERKGSQAEIWESSKHAQAFKALTSDKALEIGKAKGIVPSESKECTTCHTFGREVADDNIAGSYDKTLGVQCEACHGAGSDYKTTSIMKDQAKAAEKGLITYADDAAIEKKCRTCHNEKSPTFKDFNFAEMYPKIKHRKPE